MNRMLHLVFLTTLLFGCASQPSVINCDAECRKMDLPEAIYVTPPIYPQRASIRGIEGWVHLNYTITSEGKVTDIVVVDAEPRVETTKDVNYFFAQNEEEERTKYISIFISSAIEPISKFRYEVSYNFGQAINVNDVSLVMKYNLETTE